ncbi:MAG: IclR family transcriptional regulator [Alphaproteobacteria bacterium]
MAEQTDFQESSSPSGTLYVASVEKGFRVLQAVRRAQRELGRSDVTLTEISRLSGLDKSAAQRFTNTLVHLGYLEKDARTRRYSPGVELLELGYSYLVSSRLSEIATSRMIAASNVYGTTVNLCVQHGPHVVYIVRIPHENAPFRATLIGRRIPMFSAAAGIAMLSRSSDEHVEKTLAQSDFKPMTQWTVTDTKIVRANIAAARRDGYVITDQQSLPHELSTAAPVLDAEGKAIAALQIPVYMPNWDISMVKEKIVPLVIETARAISGSYFAES